MSVEPILFSTDDGLLCALAQSKDPSQLPAAVVVDWESNDPKRRRQNAAASAIGVDTNLERDTADDLARTRGRVSLPLICRIDTDAPADDIERAIALGADELLLAMVRTPSEVERVLQLAAGRVAVGVMIETVDAVAAAADLAALDIARAYVGLMDLALERGSHSIFDALVDGTVDRVAASLGPVPFGVAGMTVPGGGTPVPSRLLVGEIVRVGCAFSFLRRTFVRELRGAPPGPAIANIRRAVDELARRSPEEVSADRNAFVDAVTQGRTIGG